VEVLGFSAQQVDNRWKHALAALSLLKRDGVSAALAPHSPYTVCEALLRRCAGTPGLLSVHVAESADEVEFLRTGGSAIRELLVARRAWDENFRPPGLSPVEYLDRLGLLRPGTLAVHLVQATTDDLETLARRGACACVCPRSNAATGVGAAPLREMLGLGLKVSLGTDSLASNRDLNLFREAQGAISLGATPEEALRMATLWGAEALGQTRLGSLEPGQEPQPLVVPVAGADPVVAALQAGAEGKARFLFEI
jgi:cytosine/adenosine deaminase-related metal-dependent hydrolase